MLPGALHSPAFGQLRQVDRLLEFPARKGSTGLSMLHQVSSCRSEEVDQNPLEVQHSWIQAFP